MDPRTVRVFLLDGNPAGILIAEIMNFSGKVIVVPRNRLGELAKRPEANRVGVYFLVGDDPDNLDREMVYIGETDNVYARLSRHKSNPPVLAPASSTEDDEGAGGHDFWTRVAFVTSTDENLTKGHVRHLESILLALARDADRATIVNSKNPQLEKQYLPESDRADMRNFVNQLQLQLSILGFGFLKPRPAKAIGQTDPQDLTSQGIEGEPVFEISNKGLVAKAREVDDEFVVLKDSQARAEGVNSWTAYKKLRQRLVDEGKLTHGATDGMLIYTEDVPFKSPSAAACVTLGRNANGRAEWRESKTQMTYGDWYDTHFPENLEVGDAQAT